MNSGQFTSEVNRQDVSRGSFVSSISAEDEAHSLALTIDLRDALSE